MGNDQITVQCEINGDAYRKYAVFDTFKRRKCWKRPAIFAAILAVFAIICFILNGALLGVILLLLGIGIPAVYFGNYFSTLNSQVKKLKMADRKLKYSINLTKEKVTIIKLEKEESWLWKDIQYAYKLKDLICIYPNPHQALLIQRESEASEKIWEFIRASLPSGKTFG